MIDFWDFATFWLGLGGAINALVLLRNRDILARELAFEERQVGPIWALTAFFIATCISVILWPHVFFPAGKQK